MKSRVCISCKTKIKDTGVVIEKETKKSNLHLSCYIKRVKKAA